MDRYRIAVSGLVACLLAGLSFGAELPPGPGDVGDCQDACIARAEEFVQSCAATGMDEARCRERGEMILHECLASCEVQPPPPPLPCEAQCEARADEYVARCAGEGVDEATCLAKRTAFLEECLQGCVPPPPSCEELCHAKAEEAYQACVAAGGDENACRRQWDETLHACIAEECVVQPPPPPDCEAACRARAQLVWEECSAAGIGEADCATKRDAFLAECLSVQCNNVPPPEPACEERCETLAEETVLVCLREGGSQEECAARRDQVLAQCLDLCAQPPPPPEPTCEESCRQYADGILQACLAEGNAAGDPNDPSLGDCRTRYDEALRRCLEAKCMNEPPPPVPTCEEACRLHVAEVYDLCRKEGGSEEDCRARTEEAFSRCILDCGQPPPVPDCRSACMDAFTQAVEACTADGGDPATCKESARASLEACIQACDVVEPPPATCGDTCALQADAIFQTCRDAGGSEEDCREKADAILSLCLERCGTGQPCESRCALAAQVVMTGCTLGNLPPEDSRRLANEVLETCMRGCQGDVPCPERCTELVERAVAECAARGGSEEECAAKAEELLQVCLTRCEGEPVPPCDLQCEEKAEELLARCLAEAGDPERCALQRTRFLEDCASANGANCTDEVMAALTVFQPFLRGDSNMDGALNITDPIAVLEWLFLSGAKPACEDAADSNDDGAINVSDAVTSLRHLFMGEGDLPDPTLRAGQDPTSDSLLCE